MAWVLTERWKIKFVASVYMFFYSVFMGVTRWRQKAFISYSPFGGCGVDAREPSGHFITLAKAVRIIIMIFHMSRIYIKLALIG